MSIIFPDIIFYARTVTVLVLSIRCKQTNNSKIPVQHCSCNQFFDRIFQNSSHLHLVLNTTRKFSSQTVFPLFASSVDSHRNVPAMVELADKKRRIPPSAESLLDDYARIEDENFALKEKVQNAEHEARNARIEVGNARAEVGIARAAAWNANADLNTKEKKWKDVHNTMAEMINNLEDMNEDLVAENTNLEAKDQIWRKSGNDWEERNKAYEAEMRRSKAKIADLERRRPSSESQPIQVSSITCFGLATKLLNRALYSQYKSQNTFETQQANRLLRCKHLQASLARAWLSSNQPLS